MFKKNSVTYGSLTPAGLKFEKWKCSICGLEYPDDFELNVVKGKKICDCCYESFIKN